MARVKRSKVSSSYSKKLFRRTARKVHKANLYRRVSRGGIRM